MLSVSIGPLAFPIAPLVTLAAIWVATIVASRASGKQESDHAETTIWIAALIGLLAARVGFLVVNRDAYMAYPWSAIDIRDGGWTSWVGFLIAGLWLAQRAWRQPVTRRAMVSAALAFAAIWIPANVAIWHSQNLNASLPVPAIALTHLINKQQRDMPTIMAGKPAVVNIWATWCGPCRVEMPTLADAQKQYGNVRFIFVNQGESAATIRTYLKREKLDLHEVWIDEQRALGNAVGSKGLPTTLFFDATGQRVDAHFGVLSAASLRAKLRSLH